MVNNQPHGGFLPTRSQLRAARAALGLSAEGLSKAAGLGLNTIARAEKNGLEGLTFANRTRLLETFERLGVSFLDDDGAGVGLRFKTG